MARRAIEHENFLGALEWHGKMTSDLLRTYFPEKSLAPERVGYIKVL